MAAEAAMKAEKKASGKKRVVVVGAGFGGIKAAKALAKENVEVTIVDRHNFHLFQPLLYQLSTSMLATDEIAYPIRSFFRQNKNVDFFMAKAYGVDKERNVLLTNHGEVPYDFLILAAGSTTNYFGMENVAKYSYGMKTMQEALHIRNHVLHMFERADKEDDEAVRRKMLTFVCVGGGPTGIEEAGSLAELIGVMRKEYHHLDFSEVSIKLIEATDKLLPMMPERLRNATEKVLRKKGIEVMLNTQVVDCNFDSLTLRNGQIIPTRTVIWAAGVKAVPFVANIGAETDRLGRVMVDETLHVKGFDNVFAIGDNANFMENGRPLPTVAPVATQQAEVCVRNIVHQMKGEEQEKFSYHDLGSMATIGRGSAVLCKGNFEMKGFFAWCAWMVVHLMRLAGTHTNITVALKWTWNLLSGVRLGRIITNIRLNDE